MYKSQYIWCLILICLLGQGHLVGQCTIDGPFPIPDNDETEISIFVDGLVLDDMDDPFQGLCGVRVRFSHDHIGELGLELRSPSGDVVTLTGPDVLISPTGFTVWDVTFLPCNEVVMPDPGFSNQWDNNQPWAVLANYNGTYWPFDGCLEDFTGSAVGLWTLTATDGQPIDDGVILEVELIFCDPLGQICMECEADAGRLSTDTVFQCVNSQSPDLDLTPTYIGDPPDDPYVYFYVVAKNGIVFDVTSNFNSLPFGVGTYDICGMSVHPADSHIIQVFPFNLSMEEYELWLLSREVCFSMTNQCAVLVVSNPAGPVFRVETICEGDIYFWIDTFFTEPGVYQFVDTGANGCMQTFHLSLNVVNPVPMIDVLIPFDCDQDVATLTGVDSVYGTNVDFQWSTPDGSILTDPELQEVEVSGSGTYILTTTRYYNANDFCSVNDTIELIDNFQIPQVSFFGDSLTCLVDSTLMRSIAFPTNSTIIWRDALGQEDTTNTHIVRHGEMYTLIAISPQGCRDSIDVVPAYDTIGPMVQLQDIDKDCLNESINITAGGVAPGLTYQWVDPTFDTIDYYQIWSTELGLFQLLLTDVETGCTGSSPLNVTYSGVIPQFQIESDTFFCLTDSISLNISSNLNEVSFNIQGPGGFSSNDHMPVVGLPGEYTIRVETVEGCHYNTLWQAPVVMDSTQVQIEGDSLSCASDSVQLLALVDVHGADYSWTGPMTFASDEDTITVGNAGVYQLEVTTKTGCILDGMYEVLYDTLAPSIGIVAGILDCSTDSVQLQVVGGQGDELYDWIGPMSFESQDRSPFVMYAGLYEVTVTGSNGCEGYFQHLVQTDHSRPNYSILATPIMCDTTYSTVHLTTDAVFVEWTATGFTSNDTLLNLPVLDTYMLYLRGANGCDTTIDFTPPVDTAAPVIELFTDTLGCNRDTVPLYIVSDVMAETFQWNRPVLQPFNNPVYTTESGWFTVEVSGLNGCVTTDSIEVIESFDGPDVQILGADTINCVAGDPVLRADPIVADVVYTWIRPDLSTLSDTIIDVDQSGWYTLIAEAPNSCRDTAMHRVVVDTSLSAFDLSADTIDCNQNSAFVSANVESGETISWLWPNNVTSFLPSFITFVPGTYRAVKSNEQNGCTDTAFIEVLVDTTQVDNHISGDSMITCDQSEVTLYATILSDAASLIWTGPGLNITDSDSVVVTMPGWYYLQTTVPSGCEDLDSMWIGIDTVSPMFTLSADPITCLTPTTQILLTGDTSDVVFDWSGPFAFSAMIAMPHVTNPGVYVLQASGQNGCLFVDSIDIAADTLLPTVQVDDRLLSCADSTVSVMAMTTGDVVLIEWRGPLAWQDTGRLVSINQAGTYVVEVETSEGCSANDTFEVRYDAIGAIRLSVDTISCREPEATHRIHLSESNTMIEWLANGTTMGTDSVLLSSYIGVIDVRVENDRGCRWDTSFQVASDTLQPMPIIRQNALVDCSDWRTVLSIDGLASDRSYRYHWRVLEGALFSPMDSAVVEATVGRYTVEVIDLINGCSGRDTFRVRDETDGISILGLSVEQPNCNNDYIGSIAVLGVANATGQVLYMLNNGPAGPDSLFTPLSQGTYIVTAMDESGCTDRDTVSIIATDPLFIDAESDTVVELGSSVFIRSIDNVEDGAVAEKYWSVLGDTLCSGCDDLHYEPTMDAFVAVHIIDSNGCRVADSVWVQVIVVPRYFVPSAFSPNDDGINDTVGPFTGAVVSSVRSFSIYSRWGNCVHQRNDLPADDPNLFWDGTFNGEAMNPGVFVYHIAVELLDGTVSEGQGEIHLIR